MILRQAGLIYEGDSLIIKYTNVKELGENILNFGNKIILFSKENSKECEFDQVKLTPAGNELMQSIDTDKNYTYLDRFIASETKNGLIQFRILDQNVF
jgi:hypothetical protein